MAFAERLANQISRILRPDIQPSTKNVLEQYIQESVDTSPLNEVPPHKSTINTRSVAGRYGITTHSGPFDSY